MAPLPVTGSHATPSQWLVRNDHQFFILFFFFFEQKRGSKNRLRLYVVVG